MSSSRQKVEDMRRKEEAERTKEVLQEFVQTFERAENKLSKTFVRGDVFQVGGKAESAGDSASSRSAIYQPSSAVSKRTQELEAARAVAEERARKFLQESQKNRPKKPGRGSDGKRMSNLEAFKEELKRVQEERAERRKHRGSGQDGAEGELADVDTMLDIASDYDVDPNSTNLFVANLNPEITEKEFCNLFGNYGPLASYKLLWPRGDDDRPRNSISAFVAYMTRKDAERALTYLNGIKFLAFDLKLSWGKPVTIPFYPSYVPDAMLDMMNVPPCSGLPFNAQPKPQDREAYHWPTFPNTDQTENEADEDPEKMAAYEKMIQNAVVKVVIPSDRQLLCLIHRTIEFVIREGPLFEEMLMEKEYENPAFSFLHDYNSQAHVYYRWKLFSILQGDTPFAWRTSKFRMFKGGSIWQPPPTNIFQKGMPEELYVENLANSDSGPVDVESGLKSRRSVELNSDELMALHKMLEELTLERKTIGMAMMWCVDHCDSAELIVNVIVDSLIDPHMSMPKKIARLYLLSDVLANCTVKVQHVSFYRKFIGNRLEEVFHSLHTSYKSIGGRLRAEQIRHRVNNCFRVWEDMVVYPYDFVAHLQNIFLGLVVEEPVAAAADKTVLDNLDGEPLDVVQANHDDQQQRQDALDDYDGVPIEQCQSNNTTRQSAATRGGFVRSKWEKVEPERVEEQAMTSTKWEQLTAAERRDDHQAGSSTFDDDDIDGVPLDDDDEVETSSNAEYSAALDNTATETPASVQHATVLSDERRQQLREVELKVMQYQDQLESGKVSRTQAATILQQVDEFRRHLLDTLEQQQQQQQQQRVSAEGAENKSSSSSSAHRGNSGGASDKPKRKRSSSRSRSSKQSKRQRSRSAGRHRRR